ncbi:MAG: type III pantothenate kinase [Candidatus Omnitrophica bacterium]|nr:type III pantothenate kinase [Candidatus Omnitrophota bacterium]
MIVVDVGNTSISLFQFKGKKITKIVSLSTRQVTKKAVKDALVNFSSGPILLCSVVPKVSKLFQSLNRKVYLIGKEIKVPIGCKYKRSDVGSDRLVAALAAKNLFPKVRIVLDFGTAITFDFLSVKGDYQGGIILPGAGSTLSVFSSCALLPKKIKITKTKRIIPKDTAESISKGLTEGFSVMINSLVKKYCKLLKIPRSATIVVTGGEAAWVKSKLDFSYSYEPYLVAKGLQSLAAQYLSQ